MRTLPQERKQAPKRSGTMNTYEIVTERIITLLEEGVIPCRRPWSAAGAPRNLVSKKIYRGVNFFLLSASKYFSPCWLTLKQANDVGGSVRKGEHGEIVVFWRVDDTSNVDVESDPEQEGDEENRRRFVLRFYRVWNVEQCSLPQAVTDKLPKDRSVSARSDRGGGTDNGQYAESA
jgi:antirestriction protein ArdC